MLFQRRRTPLRALAEGRRGRWGGGGRREPPPLGRRGEGGGSRRRSPRLVLASSSSRPRARGTVVSCFCLCVLLETTIFAGECIYCLWEANRVCPSNMHLRYWSQSDARVHGAVLGWLGRAQPVPPAQQADNCGRNTLRFGRDSLATCNPGAGQSFHHIVLEEIAIVKED